MIAKKDTAPLKQIQSQFPLLRLKFGVERQTNKIESVPDGLQNISLDMVESWTGKVEVNNSEDAGTSTDLVKYQPRDVLFNKLRPYLAKAFEAENKGAASPEFLVLHPTKFHSRFLLYLLLSEEFIERVDASTYGAKMPRASWNFIGDIQVPCPDQNKQELIADFLDYNTSQIDTTIHKSKQLLDKFKERRSSVVYYELVQDDTHPEDSGQDLSDIFPSEWDILKLKWGSKKIGSGLTPKGGSKAYVDDGITFIRSQNVHFDGLYLEDVVYIDEKTNRDMNKTQLKSGDVLLNITGASIGRCCVVEENALPANINQHVCIIRPIKDRLNSKFLNYVISSPLVQKQIFSQQEGASREAITFEQIGDFSIPLPPLNEQYSIVNRLDTSIETIDKTIDNITTKIELLKEKRRSLIAHTVTGQIDLSDWDSQEDQELPA